MQETQASRRLPYKGGKGDNKAITDTLALTRKPQQRRRENRYECHADLPTS